MAQTFPVSTEIITDQNSCTPPRRRELFPTNDDDSDDLGHISPLSDSTPPDSPINSPSYKVAEHTLSNFNKSTIADYIILENIHDTGRKDPEESIETTGEESLSEKTTPLSNRFSHITNESRMSSLYLSPVQITIPSAVVTSPKKDKYKLTNNDDTPIRKSPTVILKTPHVTSVLNSNAPKLIRKSPLGNFPTDLEFGKRKMPFSTSPPSKHPKLDQGSKVRTVLFPKSEVAVPTTSFYSKSNIYLANTFKNIGIKTKKIKHKTSSLFLCGRTVSKKRFGQINAGVRHKIRKPKRKRIAQGQLLKAALNIIDNSELNDYLNDIKNICSTQNTSKKQLRKIITNETSTSTGSIIQDLEKQTNEDDELERILDLEKKQRSRKREFGSSPDLSKKFFKFKRSNATVTVEKHLKLKIDDGKLSLLENKKLNTRCKAVDLKIDLNVADLIVPENENLISPEQIDNILFRLDNDKENNVNSEQAVFIDEQNSKCAEHLILKAHDSVTMSENAIHLHTSSENQRNKNNNLSLNCSLLPKQTNEKSILLSPTSQMCNMTSGLALNSPKKAKQNINNVLNNKNMNITESFNEISSASDMEQEKLFPIFYGANTGRSNSSKIQKAIQTSKKLKPLPKNQMLLDAGQKRFGATQCTECRFVYHMGDANDELMHLNYHNAGNTFRFTGWKDERVLAKFQNARIIRVLPSDPKSWLRKVKELLEVVNRDLGYYEMPVSLDNTQVYLYIKNKAIAGCLVAESKNTAYRMLTEDVGIDLCSEKSYPIKCGVTRIWVSQAYRREGIGTSLLNSLRGNFMYGSILTKDDVAFSSPTDQGKAFAIKYFNTPNFLVYTS